MNEYTVLINGVEHTVQLSEEDAKAQGLEKRAKPAQDKARTAPNKAK